MQCTACGNVFIHHPTSRASYPDLLPAIPPPASPLNSDLPPMATPPRASQGSQSSPDGRHCGPTMCAFPNCVQRGNVRCKTIYCKKHCGDTGCSIHHKSSLQGFSSPTTGGAAAQTNHEAVLGGAQPVASGSSSAVLIKSTYSMPLSREWEIAKEEAELSQQELRVSLHRDRQQMDQLHKMLQLTSFPKVSHP